MAARARAHRIMSQRREEERLRRLGEKPWTASFFERVTMYEDANAEVQAPTSPAAAAIKETEDDVLLDGLAHLLQVGENSAYRKGLEVNYSKVTSFHKDLISQWWYDQVILLCIIVNAGFMAAQDMGSTDDSVPVWEWVFNSIFTVEMFQRIIAMGLGRQRGYFSDSWNRLDFLIVWLSWLPILLGALNLASVSAVNFGAIRGIRVLKVLRTIKSVKSLRELVGSLINAVPQLANILLLLVFLFYVFGIVSIQLFQGRLRQRCVDSDTLLPTGDDGLCTRFDPDLGGLACFEDETCSARFYSVERNATQAHGNPGGGWITFDNVLLAFVNILACISLEGWVDTMYLVWDSTTGVVSVIFFILLVVFGSMFVLNLFVAVLYEAYVNVQKDPTEEGEEGALTESGAADGEKGDELASEEKSSPAEEGKYAAEQTDLAGAKGLPKDASAGERASNEEALSAKTPYVIKPPQEGSMRAAAYGIVMNPRFDTVVTALIVLNILAMAAEHHGQPVKMTVALWWLNLFFTVVFAAEMVIKVYALLPRGYISNWFNIFDSLIVAMSLVEFVFDPTPAMDDSTDGLLIDVKTFRALRLVRAMRSLKLVHKWKSFKHLLDTIVLAAPSMTTFTGLACIFVAIFALMGMELFGGSYNIDGDTSQLPRPNFYTFGNALVAVFVLTTGENWNDVLFTHMSIAPVSAAIYCSLCFAMGNFVVINLFLAILLDNFARANPDGGNFYQNLESENDAGKIWWLVKRTCTVGLITARASCCACLGLKPDNVDAAIKEVDKGNPSKAVTKPPTPPRSVDRETGFHRKILVRDNDIVDHEHGDAKLVLAAIGEDMMLEYATVEGLEFNIRWFIGFLGNRVLSRYHYRGFQGYSDCFSGAELMDEIHALGVFTPHGAKECAQLLINIGHLQFSEPRVLRALVSMQDGHAEEFQEYYMASVAPAEEKSSGGWMGALGLSPSAGAQRPPSIFERAKNMMDDYEEKDSERGNNQSSLRSFADGFVGGRASAVIHLPKGTEALQETSDEADSRRSRAVPFLSGSTLYHFAIMKPHVLSLYNKNAQLKLQRMEIERQRVAAHKGGMLKGTSCFFFTPNSQVRRMCVMIVQHSIFDNLVYGLILVSSVFLALDEPTVEDGSGLYWTIYYADWVLTSLFTLEMVIKIVALGSFFTPKAYFKDGWNILDFIAVFVSWLSIGVGSSVGAFRALRALRAMRPLRMVSRNPGMKLVVDAILQSLPSVANVVFVVTIIFLIFAIVGVSFFSGVFYYCKGSPEDYYELDRDACVGSVLTDDGEVEREWTRHNYHFDDAVSALVTLFEMASLEMWPVIMFVATDTTEEGMAPARDSSPGYSLFFVIFVVVGSFFVVNLFVGVVIDKFAQIAAEKEGLSVFLTSEQLNWISSQKQLTINPPDFGLTAPTCFRWLREPLYNLIARKGRSSELFEIGIIIIILLNVLAMSLERYGQEPWEVDAHLYLDVFFTVVFVLEFVLKILAMGPWQYFRVGWNQLDFVLVVFAVLAYADTGSFSIGMDVTIFRVLRCGRMVKLVRVSRDLQILILTLIQSLPSLANVGSVLALVYFVFSIMAMSLFGDATWDGEWLHRQNNFQTFGASLLTLFRCSTGESWNGIMHELANQGYGAAYVFFIGFTIIANFILVNLFVGVILDAFVQASEDNSRDTLTDLCHDFADKWRVVDPEATLYVPAHCIVGLLYSLKAPYGLVWDDIKKQVNRQQIVVQYVRDLKLKRDHLDRIFYLDVISAIAKRTIRFPSIDVSTLEDDQFALINKILRRATHKRFKRDINANISRLPHLDIEVEMGAATSLQRLWRARNTRRAFFYKLVEDGLWTPRIENLFSETLKIYRKDEEADAHIKKVTRSKRAYKKRLLRLSQQMDVEESDLSGTSRSASPSPGGSLDEGGKPRGAGALSASKA